MNILALLDELQSIGRNGLAYARDPFDRERYQRLVELASQSYAEYLEVPAAEVRARWAREVGQVTPNVGVEAAVFDAWGRILLLRRADDGCWGLPGGWLEPNETPEEGVLRETREETGVEVRIVRLVGVFTRRAGEDGGVQSTVAVVYLCEPAGGALRGSHEGTEVGFQALEEVPAWHGWHQEHAAVAFRLWRGEE